ncbi:hypothetical protein HYV57_05905 [Candidatus Peregrinibacteria bacterium]|nr:hypothetical protein [Candidatus Peregrinibacteria bacterium]
MHAENFLSSYLTQGTIFPVMEFTGMDTGDLSRALISSRTATTRILSNITPFEFHEISPFSPENFTEEELAEIETGIDARNLCGTYIIPELLLPLIEANLAKQGKKISHCFDLSNPKDAERLITERSRLLHDLENEETIICVRCLEKANMQNFPRELCYDLMFTLRGLEDAAVREKKSLFLTTVGPGEQMPSYTVEPISPFGLSADKIGFSEDAPFTAIPNETIEPLDWLTEPRRELQNIQGNKRSSIYASIIGRVIDDGINIVFRAPRRGGKTSMIAILRDELKKRGKCITQEDLTEIRSEEKTTILARVEEILKKDHRSLFCMLFEDLTDEEKQQIHETDVRNLPTILTGLWEQKGRKNVRMVIMGDEFLERACASFKNRGVNDVVALLNFMKDAKEMRLPITFCIAVTDYVYPSIIENIKNHPDNERDAHLSAFSLEQIGIMRKDEARELCECLIQESGLAFPSPRDRENFIIEVLKLSCNHMVAINQYVQYVAQKMDMKKVKMNVEITTAEIFKNYFQFMTHWQRDCIAMLSIARNGEIMIQAKDARQPDLEMLKNSGYIDVDNADESGRIIRVRLCSPGFRPVAISHFQNIAYGYSNTYCDQYMSSCGESQSSIDLSHEWISDDGRLTEEARITYESSISMRLKYKKEIRDAVMRAALSGKISINELEELQEFDDRFPIVAG